jgi:hypothetical protein
VRFPETRIAHEHNFSKYNAPHVKRKFYVRNGWVPGTEEFRCAGYRPFEEGGSAAAGAKGGEDGEPPNSRKLQKPKREEPVILKVTQTTF